jgi:hypothetical protein
MRESNVKRFVVITLLGSTLAWAGHGVSEGEEPFKPGRDGWLTLFDGSDLAKWKPSKGSDWALKEGVLAGSKGEIASHWFWADFEAVATVRGRGSLRFRVSLAPMPDQPGYVLDLGDGAVRAADGRVVAKGGGSAAAGWREVALLVSKGKFTVRFAGRVVAEGSDASFPEKGYLALAADGKPLELKLLRIRPRNVTMPADAPAPNDSCYVCHANFEKEPLNTAHLKKDIGCATCHGPSLPHRSDEDNVTVPDVMFTRGEVEPSCLRCHTAHKEEKKRKDGDGPPPPNPTCTDCHGQHKGRN